MRAAGSGWRGGASCCLGRRLTGGERRAGGREADKHLRGDLRECRIQSSKLLCQSTQEQGLGAGQRRAEFAMLNTLVGVGSEELTHSARHAGGPALRELLVWEGRPRRPGPRGQSTTGGWVRADRRCGGRDGTRGTERKRGSGASTQRTECTHSLSHERGPMRWGVPFLFLPVRKRSLKG